MKSFPSRPAKMDYNGDTLKMNKNNVTDTTVFNDEEHTLDLLMVTYPVILVIGVLGNTATGMVILKNKVLHTATNLYRLSLAISNFILLVGGLLFEVQKSLSGKKYPLDGLECFSASLASETAANATVLTVTAFTVERYVAICRPFANRTISSISETVKCIFVIWVVALLAAVPLALQYGEVSFAHGQVITACALKSVANHQVFLLSSFLFFVVPMTTVTVMHVLIGKKLENSTTLLQPANMTSVDSIDRAKRVQQKKIILQKKEIKMLVGVTITFATCWTPYHVQRAIAIYSKMMEEKSDNFYTVLYLMLTYISGVLYFLPTAINPVLYFVMSNEFRNAFKVMLSSWCKKRPTQNQTCNTELASETRTRLHRFAMSTTEYDHGSVHAQCFEMREETEV